MAATAATALSVLALAQPSGGATSVAADWEMNEPAGSGVMLDATGAHDGAIDPNATAEGLTLNGSFYHWSQRCSACLPVAPDRVVQVPDAADGSLDIPDPNTIYTLTFRFRTHSGAGNYMQKGQSATKGGQVKVQAPKGNVQCLFKGANGVRVGTGGGPLTNDGLWHTVSCVHTATKVQKFTDGVLVGTKNGATGPIDNKTPFLVGGKSFCDQITVTCDYFVGDIDWVEISHG
jgi:hypothetical protein